MTPGSGVQNYDQEECYLTRTMAKKNNDWKKGWLRNKKDD
jgi:hypothetical protein